MFQKFTKIQQFLVSCSTTPQFFSPSIRTVILTKSLIMYLNLSGMTERCLIKVLPLEQKIPRSILDL